MIDSIFEKSGRFDVEPTAEAESHTERIICPQCTREQVATVEHSFPFFSYVHICKGCEYIIMESEWERVEDQASINQLATN